MNGLHHAPDLRIGMGQEGCPRFHQTHGHWLITFALARNILLAQGIEFAEDGNHRFPLPPVAVNAVGIPAAAGS